MDSWFFDIGFPHILIPSKIDGVYLKGGQNVSIFHRALLNMKQVSGIVRRFINVEETKPTETLKTNEDLSHGRHESEMRAVIKAWSPTRSSKKKQLISEILRICFKPKSMNLIRLCSSYRYTSYINCVISYTWPFDGFKTASFGINPCAARTPLFKWLNQQKTVLVWPPSKHITNMQVPHQPCIDVPHLSIKDLDAGKLNGFVAWLAQFPNPDLSIGRWMFC